jgi:shikimate kinase / 3-dehydroquinate synthase
MLPWSGKNIYFIGFMASGKSRIGREFAGLLGWPFHDTDTLIEKRAGKEISQIFKDDGEQHFRDLECAMIQDISAKKNNIIALGGGAVLRDENWQNISESGITICLVAPVEILSERIARNQQRPLLANLTSDDRIAKISEMLSERQPLYDRSQFTFKSSNDRPINEFVQHIFDTLLENL